MVASTPQWSMRESNDYIDVYEAYANREENTDALFSLVIHYAGMFTDSPGRSYVNGVFSYFDCIDIDEFSIHELNDMVKKLGLNCETIMYYSFLRPDMNLDNGLYALGNDDDDVRQLAEYIRVGYKLIEVFIEHDETTVYTYIQAAYNTPSKRCFIVELPDHEKHKNAQPSNKKHSKSVSGSCAKKLMLDWREDNANVTSEGSSRNENITDFAQDSYSVLDDFLGEDNFDPFFGLDDEVVHANISEEVDVTQEVDIRHKEKENSDGEGSESDVLVDKENEFDDVQVDMEDFDRTNAKTMGNEYTAEVNAYEELDTELGIDGIDNDEFESASDEDPLDRIRTRKIKKIRRTQNQFVDGGLQKVNFYVGQEFSSAAEVKDLIHKHSIESRRELYLKKNDKVRVRAECKGTIPVFPSSQDGPSQVGPSGIGPCIGSSQEKLKKVGGKPSMRKLADNQCPWVLQVSKLKDETWKVKTFDDTHKCLQSRKIKYCTAEFLSTDITDQLETNPEVPVRAIQEQLEKKYRLEVSRMKAFRAKTKAVEHIRGDFTLQYKQLRDYVMELQHTNPNTTIRIGVESEADHMCPTRVFKRIYVCLGAAKEGFKACMRQFLGFDGTFMKGPFPGQLLTAVGVDPNNGIYPLAYGIVETESRESWTWFLEQLKGDLDLQDNSNFTFISDRQKGIILAIKDVFPAAEHIYCLRHIHENMKLKWSGTAYNELLWKAATALTVPRFNEAMNNLKILNKECHDWLAKIPPMHWARSHFSGRAKTDMLLNNICEGFNAQLVDGRDRPIISTLEYAREYLMKRIVNVKKVIEKSDGPLTPTATKLFNVVKAEASECIAQFNGGHLYCVTGPWGDVCVVDVQNRTCSCRKWEVTGLPCKHAVATNWNMAANKMEVGLPESWVHPCYRLQTWREVYSHHINPIRHKSFWPKCPIPTSILPPKYHPQVGRPQKARKKSLGEDIPMVNTRKLSRKNKTVTCELCKTKRHNKRSCKGPTSKKRQVSEKEPAGGGNTIKKTKKTANKGKNKV